MEELLKLIKETDEFNEYVALVEANSETPKDDKYTKDGILGCLSISKEDDTIYVGTDNLIGNMDMNGERLGYAVYEAKIYKEDNDLMLKGKIEANFTSFDNTMLEKTGIVSNEEEPILNKEFTTKFKNKANVIDKVSIKK